MKVFIRAQKITRKRLCVWCGLMIYIAPIATCSISHKIIHVHSNVIWDWQYYMEYSHIQTAYGNIMQNICQSHITLLWNWIMLCPTWREEGAKRIVFVQYPHTLTLALDDDDDDDASLFGVQQLDDGSWKLRAWCRLMSYIAPIGTCFISHNIIHIHKNVMRDWH